MSELTREDILRALEEARERISKAEYVIRPHHIIVSPPPLDWEGTMDEWVDKFINEFYNLG